MSTPNAPTPAPAQQTVNQTQGPAGAHPQQTQSAQPTKAEQARMMRVKIEGKEVEIPESEVLAGYQQGKVASQRFQEAAAMKKEAQEILNLSKKDQREFFKRSGIDPRKWAEDFLMDELKRDAESPDQKKSRENEERLRQYEENEKRTKETAHKQENDRLTNEKRQEFDVMFVKALNESGLPKTPFTIKRMAELQLVNIKKGLELGPQQLAKIVREDYATEQKTLLSALDGDQLIEFLGPDLVKKLSKAQIAKLKARGVATSPRRAQVQRDEPAEGNSRSDWQEYQRRNRGRAG